MPATQHISSHSSPRFATRAGKAVQLPSWTETANSSNLRSPPQRPAPHEPLVLTDGRMVYDKKTKKIKRPRNAFIFFRSHLNTLPDGGWKLNQNNLSRLAGEIWEKMSTEEKAPFFKMYEEENAWYVENIPEYAARRRQEAPKRDRRTRIRRKTSQPKEGIMKSEPGSPNLAQIPEFARLTSLCTSSFPPSTFDRRGGHSEGFVHVVSELCRMPKIAAPQASKPVMVDEMEAFLDEWTTCGDSDEISQMPRNDFCLWETPLLYPPPTARPIFETPVQFETYCSSFTSQYSSYMTETPIALCSDEAKSSSFPYISPQPYYPPRS